MSKKTICLILGLWIAVMPWLGFPPGPKNWIITVSGLLVAIIAYWNVRPKAH